MRHKSGSSDLTTGPVWKRLLIFFLPIAAGTCIQQLYNAVDGMIVGRFVGTVALAAVGGSSAQIINLLIGFFVALTSGAAVIIAQIFGAGKEDDIQRATGCALGVCLQIGLVLAVFGLIAAPGMLRLLKTPGDTIADAVTYLRIYFLGVPFILILNMESNMLRSVGDSTSPFLYMVAGCVSNIVLDFVFVVFCGWGVAGVAAATVLAQIINMALLTWKLMTADDIYRLNLSAIKPDGRYLRSMMRIGIPAGLQSSMYAFSNMVIQIAVNSLGTVVVASWAMSSKADGIYWAVSNAMGAAITTFIGQNLGAGKTDRMKQCVKQGMFISQGITILLSTAIMLLARPILGILTTDTAVIDTTQTILGYFVPFYFIWTVVEVLSAVLRGAGDAVKPVVITGIGICLFRMVWMVTIFAKFGTLFSLSMSYIASWLVTDIALVIYYIKGDWLSRAKNRLLN